MTDGSNDICHYETTCVWKIRRHEEEGYKFGLCFRMRWVGKETEGNRRKRGWCILNSTVSHCILRKNI